MLKLEKISRDRQISVIVRDKECFFTRSLIIALAIAAGIHFLFLVVFNISPFKIRLSQIIFPPVQVEVDASPKDTAILAQVDTPKPIASGLPTQRPSLPIMHEYPTFLAAQNADYIKENRREGNPFLAIENDITSPSFPSGGNTSLPPLSIVVSGLLADIPVLDDGLKGKKVPGIKASINQRRVVFDVLVEGRSGSVIWFQPVQLTENSTADRFVETIIREMQFHKGSYFVTAGEIEFHFNENAE